jgi:hypothetical protein
LLLQLLTYLLVLPYCTTPRASVIAIPSHAVSAIVARCRISLSMCSNFMNFYFPVLSKKSEQLPSFITRAQSYESYLCQPELSAESAHSLFRYSSKSCLSAH